jgi:cobalt/nickel transport system permease protein
MSNSGSWRLTPVFGCLYHSDWSKIPRMHIPDGFLTNRLAVALDILSGAGILYAARRAKVDFSSRRVPIMGVLGAFVFAAQMLNFPILGGTSGHLIGGSLLAILLGPMAGLLTMATVIIAQALFLQDGGLIALGANIFNISAVTCFSGYGIFKLFGGSAGSGKRLLFAGFLAGWSSVMISAACCALEMGLSGAIPLHIGLTTMLGYHAIVGVVEGMLTAGVLSFLFKVRPDLMNLDGMGKFGVADWIGALVFVAIPAYILVAAGSSALPDPLERLLAMNPLLPEAPIQTEKLSSSGRYEDYLLRAGFFVLFIALWFVISRLTRHKKGGHEA